MFEQALVEATGQGWAALGTVCLRELGGLPTTLLREYWGELKNKKEERIKVFYLFALIVLTIACWLVAGIMWGAPNPAWLIVLAIAARLFVSALTWAARKVSAKVWIYAGLFFLAGLFFPDLLWQPFTIFMEITPFLILSMVLIIVAFLLNSGLNLYQQWQSRGAVEGRDSQVQRKYAGRAVGVVLGLGVLLLAKTLHNLYWLTVWDNTSDSLGFLWLVVPVLAALFSGVMLSITLLGRTKLTGFLYSLLVTVLMIAVSALAQRVDFRELTEERARQASQAIEAYYVQEGRYPQDLRQLTPRYILSLPGPVIIYGQDWCYDAGDDYYRLGYVYREHWSSPYLTGRIYKTRGAVPDLDRMCENQVVALQKRFPDARYEYWMDDE